MNGRAGIQTSDPKCSEETSPKSTHRHVATYLKLGGAKLRDTIISVVMVVVFLSGAVKFNRFLSLNEHPKRILCQLVRKFGTFLQNKFP